MVSGESHYFQGRRYRLRIIEQEGTPQVCVKGNTVLELRVPPGTDEGKRRYILNQWYRRELKCIVPELLAKWEPVMHVQDYIIVHAMVHLLERHHNDRFKELIDHFMSQWRLYRDELN